MCPVPESDGHDPPGLVCDFVPSLAAVIDDVVVVLEDAIGQVVISHELPEIFDGVQLRRSWRQRQQGDVVGKVQGLGCVPAGLIEDQNSVMPGLDLCADLGEMGIHAVAVAIGHDDAGGTAGLRADSTEDVGPLGSLIFGS